MPNFVSLIYYPGPGPPAASGRLLKNTLPNHFDPDKITNPAQSNTMNISLLLSFPHNAPHKQWAARLSL